MSRIKLETGADLAGAEWMSPQPSWLRRSTKSLRSSSAKTQTKSYALRLQARAFLLAAKEGIWLYQQSDGFSAERLRHWTWKDIEHPDRLHELSVVLGRGRGIGSRKATNPGDNQPVTSGEVIGRSLS